MYISHALWNTLCDYPMIRLYQTGSSASSLGVYGASLHNTVLLWQIPLTLLKLALIWSQHWVMNASARERPKFRALAFPLLFSYPRCPTHPLKSVSKVRKLQGQTKFIGKSSDLEDSGPSFDFSPLLTSCLFAD